MVIDVSELGVSGYDAADWLREQQRVDMELSDHRRVEATLSVADDDQTATRLVEALRASPARRPTCPGPKPSRCPASRNSSSAGHAAP